MPRTKSLKVLQRQIRELQAEAVKIEQTEKPGIKQLRKVIAKFKLRPTDIKVALSGRMQRAGSTLKGLKVKPKYRNPDENSETWSGRGRMPLWMAALVKKGKKVEDFVIR